MAHAIDLARKSLERDGGSGFAALIVRNGQILVAVDTRPEDRFDPTCHAETTAIRQAGLLLQTRDLSDCELYTTCIPCAMCAAAIWWARIGHVYYAAGTEDCMRGGLDLGVLDAYVAAPVEQRSPVMERLCAEQGAELFEEWRLGDDAVVGSWAPPTAQSKSGE